MRQFYTNNPTDCLRLGDVVSGFSIATPSSDRLVKTDDTPHNLVITVVRPRYLVVMTPCCSIENGVVVLAPLANLRPAFFQNPHFVQDLARINRKVHPKDSVPPISWDALTPEQKAVKLNLDPGYVFLDCFVYEPHDFLPRYSVKKGKMAWETEHYMVDFKAMYRFECKMIRRENKNTPVPDGCNKLLELTAAARKELRDKLTYFFSRPADEDLDELLTQSAT